MNELIKMLSNVRDWAGKVASATRLPEEMTKAERERLYKERIREIRHRMSLKYPKEEKEGEGRETLSKKEVVPGYYKGKKRRRKRNLYDLF